MAKTYEGKSKMTKSCAVRKHLLRDPDAKPIFLAKKYNIMLPDVYTYRKQVREVMAGETGAVITSEGKYIPAAKAVKKVDVRSAVLKVAASESKLNLLNLESYIDTLVQSKKLNYKAAYAIHLVANNKIKDAIAVLNEA